MALQIALANSPVGLPLPAAYARVESVDGELGRLAVSVSIYATEAARRSGSAQMVDRRRHTIDTATLSGPLWPALYAALRALPEYADAVDC